MAVCGGQLQQFLPLRRLRLDALGANQIDGAEPRAGGVIAIIRRALQVAEAALRVAAGQGVVEVGGTERRHRRDVALLGRAREPVLRRSEEHTSELPSLMRISYAVFCLKKTKHPNTKK